MGPLMLFFLFACLSFFLLSHVYNFIHSTKLQTIWWCSWTKALTVTFFVCVCHRRSSVICPTAPPRPSLLRGSPRGSGSPSRSPSDHLVFFKLLVTTTFSTQRVIISPWSDCHHHPHHYPILSALNVFLMLFFWFFFFFFWEYSQTHLQGRFLTFSEVQKNVIYCTCVFIKYHC